VGMAHAQSNANANGVCVSTGIYHPVR